MFAMLFTFSKDKMLLLDWIGSEPNLLLGGDELLGQIKPNW